LLPGQKVLLIFFRVQKSFKIARITEFGHRGNLPFLLQTIPSGILFSVYLFSLNSAFALSKRVPGGPTTGGLSPSKTSKQLQSGPHLTKNQKAAMETTTTDDVDESSTQFFENFMFKETELRIKQDTFVGHNAVIWDAARVLAKFFECSTENWKGKKVVCSHHPSIFST
jgi:hypothetical protein